MPTNAVVDDDSGVLALVKDIYIYWRLRGLMFYYITTETERLMRLRADRLTL